MTTQEIQHSLLLYYSSRRPIYTTNFSSCIGHECDVLMITDAGMLYEYEVKRSLSDFRADFRKTEKHERLQNINSSRDHHLIYDSAAFPNYFYYVCEDGLLPESIIPPYAGLIYIRGGKPVVIKKCKKIHTKKPSARFYNQLLRNMSFRSLHSCSYQRWLYDNNRIITL